MFPLVLKRTGGGRDIIYDNVKKLANSELNVIPDNYDTLDGIKGPFDIFKEWSEPTVVSTEYFSGGSPGKVEITQKFNN